MLPYKRRRCYFAFKEATVWRTPTLQTLLMCYAQIYNTFVIKNDLLFVFANPCVSAVGLTDSVPHGVVSQFLSLPCLKITTYIYIMELWRPDYGRTLNNFYSVDPGFC